jgi:hypothetical protein
MYDLDGNFEQEFESLRDASRFLNSKYTGHMTRAIKQGHQYLGHQFSYEKVPNMKRLKHRVLVYGKFKEGASFHRVLEYSKY